MLIVRSRNKIAIRITQERWDHIERSHPEMAAQKEKVVETISNPDLIQSGDFGELLAIKFYPTTPLTKKYLVVAYKEIPDQDGFVLTAYFTSSPSKRRQVIWKH